MCIRDRRLGIDLERCYRHWQTLCGADLGEKIATVFAAPDYPEIEDAEQALYQGFIPEDDKALLATIRSTAPEHLGTESLLFHDERYNSLLFNYRARYANETLTSAERKMWQQLKQGRLIDGDDGYLSTATYFEELDRLETAPQLEPKNVQVLKALRAWGKHIIVELAKI